MELVEEEMDLVGVPEMDKGEVAIMDKEGIDLDMEDMDQNKEDMDLDMEDMDPTKEDMDLYQEYTDPDMEDMDRNKDNTEPDKDKMEVEKTDKNVSQMNSTIDNDSRGLPLLIRR
jgi:hypothetical protein